MEKKTPEQLKKEELVADIANLEREIGTLSNSKNTHQLNLQAIEGEVATAEKERDAKLAELAVVENDLEITQISAADSKKTLMLEVDQLRFRVTDLESIKSRLEKDLETVEVRINETRALLTTERQALEVVMAEHEAFMAHAVSEKTRILAELKGLDETAKEQVVVIQSQTATQTSLDEQILTKKGELSVLEDNIESATERHATVTVELQTLEETHANCMKTTGDEFKTFMHETEAAKTVASEALEVVESDLEKKNALAVSWVAREEELNQREQFMKDRYAKAGIDW